MTISPPLTDGLDANLTDYVSIVWVSHWSVEGIDRSADVRNEVECFVCSAMNLEAERTLIFVNWDGKERVSYDCVVTNRSCRQFNRSVWEEEESIKHDLRYEQLQHSTSSGGHIHNSVVIVHSFSVVIATPHVR